MGQGPWCSRQKKKGVVRDDHLNGCISTPGEYNLHLQSTKKGKEINNQSQEDSGKLEKAADCDQLVTRNTVGRHPLQRGRGPAIPPASMVPGSAGKSKKGSSLSSSSSSIDPRTGRPLMPKGHSGRRGAPQLQLPAKGPSTTKDSEIQLLQMEHEELRGQLRRLRVNPLHFVGPPESLEAGGRAPRGLAQREWAEPCEEGLVGQKPADVEQLLKQSQRELLWLQRQLAFVSTGSPTYLLPPPDQIGVTLEEMQRHISVSTLLAPVLAAEVTLMGSQETTAHDNIGLG
ncbi:uncharacterized protein LOC118855256 [Trichosurus vulpecula]|uniref:uncharacterized protein LOC118855256 n=1 Tax=Trichosurus vulpecula TaxID=9337 RepID=UPI00186AD5CD|nr:uncharacterized protein LOC118855256 [Trichosurus vulpecula]